MAEPTCVMQAFSHAPVTSNQATEGNPMYGVEESASLGRFMSESLSWEKWSTFSRNRYVEEAEKFSKPGSVKQKKAYFEAHFERMASLKSPAAVLLGQPNTPQAELHQQQETTVSAYRERDKNDGQEETANEGDNSGFVADSKEYNPKEYVTDIIQKQNPGTEMETGLGEMKESCLKCPSIGQHTCVSVTLESKRKPVGWKSPISSDIPTKSVAKPPAVHPGKENSWTPVGRKSCADDSDKKRIPLRVSFNREFNRLVSPVIKKIGGSLSASNKDCSTPLKTSLKASGDGKEASPQSGRRRSARAIFDSSGPRWQFLSEGGAKSPCSGRKKTTTPTASNVFGLSRDKVSRRKEKLEEKFNAKAMENLQQESNLKGKLKEHSKLRQTFCFGAKLSSDSSGERSDCQIGNVTREGYLHSNVTVG